MYNNEVFDTAEKLIKKIQETEMESITKASDLIVHSVKNNGILHAFGSGHSIAGAMELVNRRGGLIPSRIIIEPSFGKYERVEGYGSRLMEEVDIRPEDIVFIISNSGINPLIIEMAISVKNTGAKIIALTSLEGSKALNSNHSSGKKLYEFADVILNNHVPSLDVAFKVQQLEAEVVGISSLSNSIILQAIIIRVIEELKLQGLEHLLHDTGCIKNEQIQRKREEAIEFYRDRILRNDNAIIG